MSDDQTGSAAVDAGDKSTDTDAAPALAQPQPVPCAGTGDLLQVPVQLLRVEILSAGPSHASARNWRNAWSGELGHWLSSPAARQAMATFDRLVGGSEHDRAITQLRIAWACVRARAYDPESDPGARWRASMASQRENLRDLAAAARTLANACWRNDRAMFWLLDRVLPSATAEMEVSPVRVWEDRFRQLQHDIENTYIPEVHGGPWWLAHTLGNLHFPEPVKPGRQVSVPTMLVAELVADLRMHTAGRAREIVTEGRLLPGTDVGRPCHDLVARLVNATLGTGLNALRVRDRLRELPRGLRLIRWPEATGAKSKRNIQRAPRRTAVISHSLRCIQ